MSTVFVHVGTRKSGTTTLQLMLRNSRRALAAQGLHLAATTQDDFGPIVAALRRGAAGEAGATSAGAAAIVERVGRSSAPRHLVTLEALAELPPASAEAVLSGLEAAGHTVHVAITARPWLRTIPSEWQQEVKQRATTPYADFVAAIRERRPTAEQFLRRQDLPGIVRRWAARLPLERVHLVACPPPSRTEGTVAELFCAEVGIDPSTVRPLARGAHNTSLSLAQAEMLRRVNLALGTRLGPGSGGYRRGVREWVTAGSLVTHEREPILLPPGTAGWVAQESRRQLEELAAMGVTIVGRAADLESDPAAAEGPSEPAESEVTQVAVTTIADLADRRWQELSAAPAPEEVRRGAARWYGGRRRRAR